MWVTAKYFCLPQPSNKENQFRESYYFRNFTYSEEHVNTTPPLCNPDSLRNLYIQCWLLQAYSFLPNSRPNCSLPFVHDSNRDAENSICGTVILCTSSQQNQGFHFFAKYFVTLVVFFSTGDKVSMALS